MTDMILKNLERLEREQGVRIILAAESGSRAWGFPSQDSDYDVRFIYLHERDWYLSVWRRRDVIETPIDAQLDINGWDLRKALQLLRNSNAPLLEWLSSPIRYQLWRAALEPIEELASEAFLAAASCHHYLSMARSSIAKFGEGDGIKIKTYMYAIRAILCCGWVTQYLAKPPMRIHELMDGSSMTEPIRREILELIRIKAKTRESYVVPKSAMIEEYCGACVADLMEKIPPNRTKLPEAEFDKVFKQILNNPTVG